MLNEKLKSVIPWFRKAHDVSFYLRCSSNVKK